MRMLRYLRVPDFLIRMILIWYSSDTQLILIWYAFDTHLILIWYASDTHLILIWYSSDTHLILIWYSSDTHLILIWYSSDTQIEYLIPALVSDEYQTDTHDTHLILTEQFADVDGRAWTTNCHWDRTTLSARKGAPDQVPLQDALKSRQMSEAQN